MTLSECKATDEITSVDASLTLADLRHDHLGLSHRTRTRSSAGPSGQRLLCDGGRDKGGCSLICRADWGQSVRTEHHLAPPNGTRGGGSGPLVSRY
jgi:hypothetical protein